MAFENFNQILDFTTIVTKIDTFRKLWQKSEFFKNID